tara:strand:+ start:4267 stop:4455 length:189 start_codon:yes stop_codon:yes gene_type:complete
MKFIQVLGIIWFSGLIIGASLMSMHYKSELKDLHCAPIVKVSTMEEAKKQIEINQAMTGVKG